MTKRSIASLVSALICLALLNGCSSNKQKPQEITEPTEESVRFEISAFSDTPSSEQEDWAAALSAFKISCRSIYRKTAWAEACSKASGTDAQNAEAFFKNNFTPWKIEKRTIGTLWIAATGEGVFSYRFDTGKLTNYRHEGRLQLQRLAVCPYLATALSTQIQNVRTAFTFCP